MYFPTVKKTIDYCFFNSNDEMNYTIGFFGREPLVNFQVIEEAVAYINESFPEKKKIVNYIVTTNGTLLNDKINRFFVDNKFDVSISLDGISRIQNKNRPFKNSGKPTYELVSKKIKRYIEIGGKPTCLITVLPEDLPFLYESVESIWRLGVDKVLITLAFGKEIIYTKNDFDEYNRQMKLVSNKMYESLLNGKKYILANISEMVGAIHRHDYKINCYLWHNKMLTVSTTGEVYSCQRLCGEDEYCLGNINGSIDFSASTKRKEIINKCLECDYQLFCGDGCPYENKLYNDDINSPSVAYCKQTEVVFNISMNLYIKLIENKELLEVVIDEA